MAKVIMKFLQCETGRLDGQGGPLRGETPSTPPPPGYEPECALLMQ